MQQRYGQKAPASKQRMTLVAILGVAGLTAGVAVITALTYNPVQYQDISFRTSEWSTEVEFEVTKPASETAICDLQALNEQFAIVGFRTVELGPTEAASNRYTLTLNTTHKATTGLVAGCRLK
jgi:hypothetical protein